MAPVYDTDKLIIRNKAICARRSSTPKPSLKSIGAEFGISGEQVRLIVSRAERLKRRDTRIAEKFRDVFSDPRWPLPA
jgi:hypothetical protein